MALLGAPGAPRSERLGASFCTLPGVASQAMELPRGLIGVVHLRAMPGDPSYDEGGFDDVLDAALRDARSYVEGGISAVIVENYGSSPFTKGTAGARVQPHQVAFMAQVVDRILEDTSLIVGVNCLRNDAISAMGIAAASGASFIRVNVHTGAYVTDQGLIEGEAHDTLRYRATLGADAVCILADVLVKHARPLAPITTEQATSDALRRGGADGIIVTGRATGSEVELAEIQAARQAAGNAPLYIGSGLNMKNAPVLMPLADGAIVGTSVKEDLVITAPVDPAAVERLVEVSAGLFRTAPAHGTE